MTTVPSRKMTPFVLPFGPVLNDLIVPLIGEKREWLFYLYKPLPLISCRPATIYNRCQCSGLLSRNDLKANNQCCEIEHLTKVFLRSSMMRFAV